MSQENKAPPPNCRQQLAADGKPYPRSSCAVCGQFSPRWKECDALLAAAPVPPHHSEQALDMVPDVGKVEVQRFWAEEAQNIRCVRAEDFDTHVTRLQAEIAALQRRLNVADQRVDQLEHLLMDWYAANCNDQIQVDDSAYHIITATVEAIEEIPQ